MILLGLAAILSLPIIFMPSEWAGWIVLYASFGAVPLMISPRRRPKLLIAIWITLALHHAVAITSVYMISLFRDSDAKMFHNTASFIALQGGFNFAPGANFYRSMLALGYSATGPSLFFGQATSCFAYALSCVMLAKLMDLFRIERHQVSVILVFGLLPALVFIGTSTMRESWQILFFMSAAYFLIRFRLKAEPWSLFLGATAALAMGFLHNGLLVYALGMLPFVLFSNIGARSTLTLTRLVGLVLTGLLFAGLGAAVVFNKLPRSESLEAITQGDALEYAAEYRESGAKGARAEYGITLDTSSPITFAQSAGLLFAYYMLAPFPWQISTGLDLAGAADSWFRLLLIFFAMRAWRSLPTGVSASIHRVLIGLYFMMSFLWALGTINYGTGIRHHIVAIWIPVLLGVPPLLDSLSTVTSRYRGKQRRTS
ncbi:MAG: hypothetical protein AAB268_02235 [Elusimicrobiota bacterium]